LNTFKKNLINCTLSLLEKSFAIKAIIFLKISFLFTIVFIYSSFSKSSSTLLSPWARAFYSRLISSRRISDLRNISINLSQSFFQTISLESSPSAFLFLVLSASSYSIRNSVLYSASIFLASSWLKETYLSKRSRV
jgi:hypothetical protein